MAFENFHLFPDFGVGWPLAETFISAYQHEAVFGVGQNWTNSAKEAGAADTAIAATTRHKSLQMIKRYGETADQLKCAPHQLKGVGL